jgi:hypothetical protein
VWGSKRNPTGAGNDDSSSGPTPEEEAALDERIELVLEEKRRALADPGPSWREWFFFDGAKWFVGLGFLIALVLVATYWLEATNYLALGLSVAAVFYGEFLLYRFLWYRPSRHSSARRRAFRPGPFRLTALGRWTPEAEEERAGGTPVSPDGGPDLKDFF